jgi:hypothetical protein
MSFLPLSWVEDDLLKLLSDLSGAHVVVRTARDWKEKVPGNGDIDAYGRYGER